MPTREERKNATRDKLYNAAEKLFMENGYDDTSVLQVTKRAKVAKGTFFVHYPSKADLLAEMGNGQLESALDIVESSARMSSWPFSRQVDHIFRSLARGVDQAPDLMRIVIAQRAFDSAERDSAAHDRLHELLVELIKTGKRTNELRADVLADRMAVHLMGVWKSSLEQWSERGGNFERWLMEAVRLTFDGLAPR